MELYYKDLISEEASLERLVDDLMTVVQGGSEFADPERVAEIRTKLERIKEGCRRISEQAVAGVRATDKVLRQYPYSSLGLAFGLGLLTAALIYRRR